MPSNVEPFVMLPGEGEAMRGPVGGPARILARAETTNGTFTAIANEIPPGQGPPDRPRRPDSIPRGRSILRHAGRFVHVHPAGFRPLLPEHGWRDRPSPRDVRACGHGAVLR